MTSERAKRKLTAILSADVKGYSRLMGEDELSTVETLKKYREVISAQVRQYSGRVVDSPGDNILAEFGSVVDAVECAVKIQEILHEKNVGLPENRKMEFRIGVNLGDVVHDEGRIYGDGVNVAARVEGLAEAGGICVSGTAFDQIGRKLPLGYEYLGEQQVKNIEKPIRVYKVLTAPEAAGKVIGEKASRPGRRPLAAVAAALILALCGLAVWNFYVRPHAVEQASVDRMAFPLPDKPSIAVLPFDNLSDDPDEEYFSDGLAEEIITGLSKIPSLFVIARSSSFIYKGKPVKVQQVSEELGVRYVLEGSVRKEGDRVRISTRLIDAVSGYHKWSRSYDRRLENIFDLQEDIMRDLSTEMQVQLTEGEGFRIWQKERFNKTVKPEAYEKQMQSRWQFFRMNPEGFALSRQLAEEAIEIDPDYYAPYVMLAFCSLLQGDLFSAEKYAQKTIDLNDSAPMAYIAMGQVCLYKRRWEKAVAYGEKALELDPNGAEVKNHLGYFLHMDGRFEEAMALYHNALRLNPYPPSFYYQRLASVYCDLGKYDKAVEVCSKGLERNPRDVLIRTVLAAAYVWQGSEENALAEATEILNFCPGCSVGTLIARMPQKDTIVLNKWVGAWRKAGLPD